MNYVIFFLLCALIVIIVALTICVITQFVNKCKPVEFFANGNRFLTDDKLTDRIKYAYERYNICYIAKKDKKQKEKILKSIENILRYNGNINIFIFNNNTMDEEDFKKINNVIKKYDNKSKLFVVDISSWMDLFKNCPKTDSENNYMTLLITEAFRETFPGVEQILFLNENTYCCGSLDRLMECDNQKYNIAGFMDEDVSASNVIINSELLLLKTSLNITEINFIKCLNFLICLNSFGDKTSPCKLFINIYGAGLIDDTIIYENIIKHCLLNYNIAYMYTKENEEININDYNDEIEISPEKRFNICFPSCAKCKDILLDAIHSFLRYNSGLNIFIFNNKEYGEEDFKEFNKLIKSYDVNSSLYVVDISPWMDIFDNCEKLKGQTNAYIRLLMPELFKQYYPKVRKILYCDEDCFCIGVLDKIMNYNYHEYDIAGFIDAYIIDHLHRGNKNTQHVDEQKVIPNFTNIYINSGLLLFKTSFDVTDKHFIKCLNFMIIYPYLVPQTDLFHDQTLITLYGCHVIDNKIDMKHLIKYCFKNYNIAHTYNFKNHYNDMIASKIIKTKDVINKNITIENIIKNKDLETFYKRFNICFSGCAKCKNMLITSIRNILKQNGNINIFIFDNNEYSKKDLIMLNTIIKSYNNNSKLFVVDISPWMDIFDNCLTLDNRRNVYIKLLMPEIFKQYFPGTKRILYCNEDCFCVGGLNKIINYDFKEDIAGFIDISMFNTAEEVKYLSPNIDYINNGLLLLKTSFDITNNHFIKCLNVATILYCIGLNYSHDQFIINIYPFVHAIFKNNWYEQHKHQGIQYASIYLQEILSNYNIVYPYLNQMVRN